MASEGSNRRPTGRRTERRGGARIAAGHRSADLPGGDGEDQSTTLMLDGRHYLVTGDAQIRNLRAALAPYIAAARAV